MISSIKFFQKSKKLASVGADSVIKIWDVEENFNCIGTLRGHIGFISEFQVSSSGRYIYSVGMDKFIKIWSLDKMNCVRTISAKEKLRSIIIIEFSNTFITLNSKC